MSTQQATPHATASPVGQILRQWRKVRSVSQWDLALDAEISARHLSFVETGRARPSREVVLRLATALDLPLREHNTLLTAAGYAQLYAERDLDGHEMNGIARALNRMLEQQEPYPALVLDRFWNLQRMNEAGNRLFGLFMEPAQIAALRATGPVNLLRLAFDRRLMRPWIANWEEVAQSLLVRLRREACGGVPDPALEELLGELLSMPDLPARWQLPDPETDAPLLIPVELCKEDLRVNFFTTLTTFGTPQDVTLQELRIESWFPSNDDTEAFLTELAADALKERPE